MVSPSAERNIAPILDELTRLFGARQGRVLEIGSGTGQHAAQIAKAMPGLTWLPSDPAERHRQSIDAWRDWLGPANMGPALALDALSSWWELPQIAEAPLDAVFCANVIHISPWDVGRGIIAGAGKALAPAGMLIFYGPFAEGGAHTGEGNARFDASLRSQNPDWGIRDLDEVTAEAAGAGFAASEVRLMPSNNRMVIFRR
ncbi:DUF938 domain-containing protein [Rhodobacteraceae bacterium NNCM2]|nr:DUF938 domain-containing protein [Coraliihabitans acroporae]